MTYTKFAYLRLFTKLEFTQTVLHKWNNEPSKPGWKLQEFACDLQEERSPKQCRFGVNFDKAMSQTTRRQRALYFCVKQLPCCVSLNIP